MGNTLTRYVTWEDKKASNGGYMVRAQGIWYGLINSSGLRGIENHSAKVNEIGEGVGALCIMNVG